MYLLKSSIYAYTFSALGLMLFSICLKSYINKSIVRKLFLVLAACMAISFFSPNIVVNVILSFLIVPIFAKKSEDVAPIFIFYFLNMPGLPYQLHIGSLSLFDWYNYNSLTVGALLFILSKSRLKEKISFPSLFSIFTLFIIYFIIGVRGTSATNAIRVVVDLICVMILPFLVIKKSINSLYDVNSLFIGLCSATASLSGLAIYEARVGWPIYTALSAHYGLVIGGGNSVKIRGGLLRSAGPFPEPTSFALWLSLGVFLIIVSRWMFKSKYYQIIASLFCIWGLSSPQSRGALLGLFCAFIFYSVVNSSAAVAVRNIAIVILCAIGLYASALILPSVGSSLGLNTTGTLNRDYRQDLFSRGIEESYKHPLIGQSVPDVMNSLSDMKQGEGIIDFVNTYLFILLTTGYFSVIFLIITLTILVISITSKNKFAKKQGSNVISVISSLLFALLIMLMFTALFGRTTAGLSMLIATAGCLSAMTNFGKQNKMRSNQNTKINLIEQSKLLCKKKIA